MKILIGSDPEDMSEVEVSERYSPEDQVEQYVHRNFESGWSDFVTVYLQDPGDPKPREFAVTCEMRLHVSVRPAR